MKRIHFLLLGLLVSLTIAAVSPTVPPTRIAPGANITVTTNGLNNYTIAGSVTNYGQSFTNITAYGSSSNAITIPGTNSLGIGNAGPALAPIHVGDYTVNSSIGSKILVSENVDNSNPGVNAHAFSDSSLIGRSGGIGYNSFDARINLGGSVDYDHYAAFQSAPVSVAVGVMQNYYAHYDVLNLNSGVVVNDYGFYKATGVRTAGQITNVYGIYIEPQTNGVTKNYGVYVAANSNYFGGDVLVTGVLTATNANFYGQTNTGNLLFAADNTYDIGASGATRPRSIYVGTSVVVGSALRTDFINNAANDITHFSFNATDTKFAAGLFQFNGTSGSFPALTRSTEYLNIVDAAGGNTSGLMINSGTPIVGALSAAAALDFDLTMVTVEDLTITVTGAAVGDVVSLGVPNGSVTATIQFTGWVSAADTVTVRATTQVIGEDPASATFRAMVTKF